MDNHDRLMKVANRLPAFLLRSPLHPLLGNDLLLLTFVGRRSGKRFTTPINYLRDGDTILMTTDSRWWRNLRGGAPVTLRLNGRDRPATAEAITDEAAVTDALRRMMRRFSRYGTFANIRRESDGTANEADIRAAFAAGRVLVRARLAPADEQIARPEVSITAGRDTRLLRAAQFISLLLAGVLVGNEFGTLVAVHPALERLPLQAQVRAEQALTRRYGTIMPGLMLATIASHLPVLALVRDRRSPGFIGTLGSLVAFLAMLGVTFAGNMPLDRQILAFSSDPDPAIWRDRRRRWDRWHWLRNGLNITGFALLIGGVLARVGSDPTRSEEH